MAAAAIYDYQYFWYVIIMDKPHLKWTEESRRNILDCNIFNVLESNCKPPDEQHSKNKLRTFTLIDTKDWAIVIPVIESPQGKKFLMVWQWRFGSKSLSLEFPGGVFEHGESPEEAAVRELKEETGLTPGKIIKLGEFSPNPAIMTNKAHFFLANDLSGGGKQNLDEDEYVDIELIDTEEVIQGMGKPPFIHALMGTALSLYNQKR